MAASAGHSQDAYGQWQWPGTCTGTGRTASAVCWLHKHLLDTDTDWCQCDVNASCGRGHATTTRAGLPTTCTSINQSSVGPSEGRQAGTEEAGQPIMRSKAHLHVGLASVKAGATVLQLGPCLDLQVWRSEREVEQAVQEQVVLWWWFCLYTVSRTPVGPVPARDQVVVSFSAPAAAPWPAHWALTAPIIISNVRTSGAREDPGFHQSKHPPAGAPGTKGGRHPRRLARLHPHTIAQCSLAPPRPAPAATRALLPRSPVKKPNRRAPPPSPRAGHDGVPLGGQQRPPGRPTPLGGHLNRLRHLGLRLRILNQPRRRHPREDRLAQAPAQRLVERLGARRGAVLAPVCPAAWLTGPPSVLLFTMPSALCLHSPTSR